MPILNDATTDFESPPALTQAEKLMPGKDWSVRKPYPGLSPLYLPLPPDQVFSRAVELARRFPRWELVRVDLAARIFEGVATTRFFRFKDDFAVRVAPEDQGARVDMRSKSRVGQGDLGANGARIRKFFEQLRLGSPT